MTEEREHGHKGSKGGERGQQASGHKLEEQRQGEEGEYDSVSE